MYTNEQMILLKWGCIRVCHLWGF